MKISGSAIVLGILLPLSAFGQGEGDLLARLIEAMSTPAGRIILQTTPQGEALAMKVLGTPIRGPEEAELLARAIHAAPEARSLEENLLQRLRMADVESRTYKGVDPERVDAFADEHFNLQSPLFSKPGDLRNVVFAAEKPATGFRGVRQRFLGPTQAAPLPSATSAKRIQQAFDRFWIVKFALNETPQGQALVTRLLPPANYRYTPQVSEAVRALALEANSGLAIDLDLRLNFIMDGMSGIHPSVGADRMREAVAELAERYLALQPDRAGVPPLFQPIESPVRGPRRGYSAYLELPVP